MLGRHENTAGQKRAHPEQRHAGLRQALQALPLSLEAALRRTLGLGRQRQRPGVVVDGHRVGQATRRTLPSSGLRHLPDGQDVIPLGKHHLHTGMCTCTYRPPGHTRRPGQAKMVQLYMLLSVVEH